MGLFNKKGKKEDKPIEQQTKPLQPLNYEPKIVIGWAESIGGNMEIRDWFAKNGYEELSIFCYALVLKNDARDWLMKNGYAHLMAMIHAVEGDKGALEWLDRYGFTKLKYIALAGQGELEGYKWIKANATVEFYMLAQKIQQVKDQIEENHNDTHSFGLD